MKNENSSAPEPSNNVIGEGTAHDVIVIGSGISSLTAAVLLAKKGKKVLVLERHKKPGGYMHCFKRFNERYDTGAHYVGAMDPGHPFHTLLSSLGVYDPETFVPLDPEAFDDFQFPGFRFHLAKGYEASTDALTRVFPMEGPAIRRFFDLVKSAVGHFPTYEFDPAYNDVPAGELFETSLAQVVGGLTQDPRLKCALYAHCPLHGVQAEEVAFGFHALVIDSLIRSPYGLRHGGEHLAARFVRELERHGGHLLLKKGVTRLRVKDRLVQAVETEDGELFHAEWIISGLHPGSTLGLLDDKSSFPDVFLKRLSGLRESVGLLGISAITNTPQPPLHPLRNFYFFAGEDPARLLRTRSPEDEPPVVFLSAARRKFAADRPLPLNLHSPAPMEWFAPWRHIPRKERPEAYHRFKRDLAERAMALVERHRPGFRSTIADFAVSSPLTNVHYTGAVEGSAYGLYHSIANTGPRAIGPRTKVLNLLLTGQNTLFPGLLGAAISGLRTSGHVIGIKPLLAELFHFSKR